MKASIVSTITALSIGLAGSVFAGQTDVQVSPSVINLSADGVTTVTIHTLEDYGDCELANVTLRVAAEDADNLDFEHEFLNVDGILSTSPDSLGNIVIKINAWDDMINSEEVPVGDASFVISGTCEDEPFLGMDDAVIIDNDKR
ncbi:MAG: hypothetical protein ABFS39_16780 [Pseudomonadota bacterium]